MTPWRKICCATDFSDSARLALDKAAELAHALDCELALVHVVTPPPAVAADLLAAPALEDDEVVRAPEEQLRLWRDEAQALLGRPVSTTVLVGEPAHELARLARDRGVDAIVVGSHGRRGLGRVILGSVAERLVRRAGCTVVVARPPSDAAMIASEAADYA